jgi:hypothetical protein
MNDYPIASIERKKILGKTVGKLLTEHTQLYLTIIQNHSINENY